MEIAEYKNIYQNENTHFFYVATHQLVISLIKKYSKRRKNLKILDAGCGTGLLANKMTLFGDVTGVDLFPEAVNFSKKRGVKVIKSSIEKLPFKDSTYDVVTSIDVLTANSIKNDSVPLKEFYRVLKPNGVLIIRVSANNWLKLNHDKHVHMNHRYDKEELKNKLLIAGFGIDKLSFINSILLPPVILKYFWEKIFKPEVKSSIDLVNPWINVLLTKGLLLENKVFLNIDIPFGIGLVAVSRKP
jgi:ubiquinone/menaquinone biosynthesis C-methylase UbiE